MRPKRHILCVEPDELALNVRTCLLETRGNYAVTKAETSAEALQKFRAGSFDMAIIALVLEPDCDGDELARRLKAVKPEIPMLLLCPAVRLHPARWCEVFLGKGFCSPGDVLGRTKILIGRKRGPKKDATSAAVRSVVLEAHVEEVLAAG